MSDELNLADLIEGMSKEDAIEYVKSHLNQQTRAEFLAKRSAGSQKQLRQEYDTEVAGLNLAGLDTNARIRKISAVKRKYIDRGLGIG